MDLAKESVYWIFRIMIIGIVIVTLILILGSISDYKVDISEIESYVIRNKIILDENCLAYNDYRTNLGIIDKSKFNKIHLQNCLNTNKGVILNLTYDSNSEEILINEDLADKLGITVATFDIIYKLTEWLHKELERRRPRQTVEEMSGEFKILKIFSQGHKRQIVGGKIITGLAKVGENFYVRRRTEVIGEGLILNLEKAKNKVGEVEAGVECGALVESKTEIVAGDVLEIFRMIEK